MCVCVYLAVQEVLEVLLVQWRCEYQDFSLFSHEPVYGCCFPEWETIPTQMRCVWAYQVCVCSVCVYVLPVQVCVPAAVWSAVNCSSCSWSPDSWENRIQSSSECQTWRRSSLRHRDTRITHTHHTHWLHSFNTGWRIRKKLKNTQQTLRLTVVYGFTGALICCQCESSITAAAETSRSVFTHMFTHTAVWLLTLIYIWTTAREREREVTVCVWAQHAVNTWPTVLTYAVWMLVLAMSLSVETETLVTRAQHSTKVIRALLLTGRAGAHVQTCGTHTSSGFTLVIMTPKDHTLCF